MKARVKSTGDIFEISDTTTIYPEHYDKSYNITEVEFLDVKENAFPYEVPDYWTRLEHQYAGMAMQGILSNPEVNLDYKSDECMPQAFAATAYNIAHALVEKMKEK